MAYNGQQHNAYHQYGAHPQYPSQNAPVAYPQVVIPARAPYQQQYVQQQFAQQVYPQQQYGQQQFVQQPPVPSQWQNVQPFPPQTVSQTAPAYHRSPQQSYSSNTIQTAAKDIPPSIRPRGPPEVQIPIVTQPVEDPKAPSLDSQVLLLSLADEYLNAAHERGMLVAVARRDVQNEQYYRLVATGLACLESVLQNFRQQPKMEALITLRYARVLYEETTNDLQAEQALTKGIELCERNRLLDLKYSMQQLLARVLYRTTPKAALKAVDKMIDDVGAYHHVAWEYAFRFLRVTLSLSSSSNHEIVSAVHNLQKISALASRQSDKAVLVFCAAVEALVHLQSASPDSLEQAKRALAAARSYQLDQHVADLPQINVLVAFVDLSCALHDVNTDQAKRKMESMQELMDQIVNDPGWNAEGSFAIPFSQATSGILQTLGGGGIMRSNKKGNALLMKWLPKKDVYTIGYLLSAAARSQRNSTDGHKAERLLLEGLSMTRSNLNSSDVVTESASVASDRIAWRRTLECHFLLELVFLLSARTDWDDARPRLAELKAFTIPFGADLPIEVKCLTLYLEGAILQGTGHLDEALTIFRSPSLSVERNHSKSSRNDVTRDISVLAALNSLLILRHSSHPDHHSSEAILSSIEPFCVSTQNKQIQAAYYLLKATAQTDSTLKTKQYLSQALQAARTIGNNQITCITLGLMSWKYFRGVVGEQAEKSARAGHAMAKKAGNHLWISVTDNMLADTLEKQGKGSEAGAAREEALRVAANLPENLKRYDMSV